MHGVLITAFIAIWMLAALGVVFVFVRVVRRADEANELGSLRREVRAADLAAAATAQAQPAEGGEWISTRLRS